MIIVHWPHFIVHSFHNIVQPDVQHVVHNENCAIVHNFEQFAPTLSRRSSAGAMEVSRGVSRVVVGARGPIKRVSWLSKEAREEPTWGDVRGPARDQGVRDSTN